MKFENSQWDYQRREEDITYKVWVNLPIIMHIFRLWYFKYGQSWTTLHRSHLSSNFGQITISSLSNLVMRHMACTEGRCIRFLHFERYSRWREERLPNHSGKACIPSNPFIYRDLRAVMHWILSGRELSLAHPPFSHSLSRRRASVGWKWNWD